LITTITGITTISLFYAPITWIVALDTENPVNPVNPVTNPNTGCVVCFFVVWGVFKLIELCRMSWGLGVEQA
jgi:hypothetical protein